MAQHSGCSGLSDDAVAVQQLNDSNTASSNETSQISSVLNNSHPPSRLPIKDSRKRSISSLTTATSEAKLTLDSTSRLQLDQSRLTPVTKRPRVTSPLAPMSKSAIIPAACGKEELMEGQQATSASDCTPNFSLLVPQHNGTHKISAIDHGKPVMPGSKKLVIKNFKGSRESVFDDNFVF